MSASDEAPLRWVKYDGVYYAALLIPNSESPMTVPDKHCFVFFLDGESGAVVPESDVEPFDLDNKARATHPAAAAGVALAEQILHGTSHSSVHPNTSDIADADDDGALNTNVAIGGVHHREYDPTAVFAGNEIMEEDAELEMVYSPDDNYNYQQKSNISENKNVNVEDRHHESYSRSHHRSHRHRNTTTDENDDASKHERHRSRHKHKKSHRSHSRHNRVKQEEEEQERSHSLHSSINENENENERSDKKVLADAEQLADGNDHWRELEEEYYNDNENEENEENDNNHIKQETLTGPTYRRGKVIRNRNERGNNVMSEALNALNSRGSLISPYLGEIRYHYRELLNEAEQHGQLLNMQEADVIRNVEYTLLDTAAKTKFLREVYEHSVSTSHTLSHAEKENAEHALNAAIQSLQDAIQIEHIIRHMVQFVDKKREDEMKPEVKRRPAHMERLAFHDASIAFMLRNTLTNAIPRELTYELANKYREQRIWRERQLQRNHGLGKTGFFAIPKPMERWSRARELMVLAHAPENQPVKPTGYTSRHYSETINKVQQNAIKRLTGQSSRHAKNKMMSGNASTSTRETNLYSSQIPAFMTTANNLIANTLAAASINLNSNNNNNNTNGENNGLSAMAAFQTHSRRPGQNYPAYYNFHDLTPSSANDVEQYRANGLASANGVLEPMNLVDNYFSEHSLPLEQEQEPLITPLHMSVDPSVDFAISPDEVREEQRHGGNNNTNSHVPSNSQSYMYSASIRLPSQESHFYSVESSIHPDNYHSSEITTATLDASHPLYSVNYNDDIGGVPQPTIHHRHKHRHGSSRHKNKNNKIQSESHASHSHYSSSRASSLASSHHRSHSTSRSHSRHKTHSISRHSHHTHKRKHSRSRSRNRSLSHAASASEKEHGQHHTYHSSSKRKEQQQHHKTQSNSFKNSNNNSKKKKLDWRESAKRAILEQLTLYLRGLKGKPAVISYDHFEGIARKLLERAVSRESERTGISMALQANNQSVPFLRETEIMLKRSVDTYVKRHFILSSRHTSAKPSMRHRSAAQNMSQPHYEEVHEYTTITNNNNDGGVRNDANDESSYHRGAEDSPVYDEVSK